MNKKIVLSAGIILLIGAFFGGYQFRDRGVEGEMQKYEQVQRVMDTGPKDTVGGSVTEINGSTLTIPTTNPFTQEEAERQVVVDDGTVILKEVFKSDEEKAADLKAYREALTRATSTGSVFAPPLITYRNITPADLRVGDFIAVTIEGVIGDKTQLEPIKITVELPHP